MASGVDHYDVYRDGCEGQRLGDPAEVGPYGWSDVAGQSTSPASGSHSYSYTVIATDVAGNASSALRRARDPDGYAPCLQRLALRPACRRSRRPRPSPSRRPPTQAGSWRPVSITTTSTATARRSTSRPIPAGGPYAWSDVEGRRRRTRLRCAPYRTPLSPSTSPVTRPRSRRRNAITIDPALSAPTSVTASRRRRIRLPQLSWVAPPTRCALHLHHYQSIATEPARLGVVIGATTFTDTTPNLLDGS